jgi:hypothetical protein
MLAAIDRRLGALSPRWFSALNTLELGLGIWLLAGVASKTALAILIVAMLGFTAVLFAARVRGYQGECGCMGSLDTRVGPLSMLRNLVLVGMAAVALLPSVAPDANLATLGVAVLLSVVLVGVYVLLATAKRVLDAPEPGLHATGENT